MPQHLQLPGDELDPQRGAGQQPGGGVDCPGDHLASGLLDFDARELEPQLGGLMHRLEQQFIAVDDLVGPALQRQQGIGAHVPRVVVVARTVEHGHRVVLCHWVSLLMPGPAR